jgi:glyoxylase-like metal-dependent hydrolase (beta-lactamase superfamily II)
MATGEFYQLFDSETSTYTYLLGDNTSREAILIDPVFEQVDRDLRLVEELGLKLVWVLDTHVHADHVTGAGEIRKRTGCKTALSEGAGVECADRALRDGDELKLGDKCVRVLATPGHTNSCMSFFYDGMVFTGDALTIRGAGRTDFQQGSPERLFDSINSRLYTLPDNTKVYPGHDYRGQTVSTIGMEKRFNSRISAAHSKAEFVKIMTELNLPMPKKIREAVPANLACGQRE